MHFADHFLRVFGQEIDIQRVFRHQFGDKRLLPGAAQVVRLGELDGEEMAPDALPERRSAVFIGETAHLGDQAPGETFAEAVPGFRQADGHFDRADPDHLTALAVFQHEQITLVTLRKFALPGF